MRDKRDKKDEIMNLPYEGAIKMEGVITKEEYEKAMEERRKKENDELRRIVNGK